MRFVTLHGLSVLNRRYRSVLIKCLLAGMVFLPHAANALNFNDGILTVDQDTVLDKSVPNVKTIAFDDTGSNHFTLDGNQGLRSIYGVVNGNMSITGAGTLKNTLIYIYGNVTGNGNTLSINGDNGVIGSGNHTISGINFRILGNSNLSLNTNTMRGGALTGSASSTITTGIFDDVDVDKFFGTAWRAQFKNSGAFSLGDKDADSSMKYGEKVYIYADQITGYYHGWEHPDAANEFYSEDRLYLREYNETAGKNTGTWFLEDKDVSLKGGKIEGNLNGGSLRIFDENSRFKGELTNVKIYIENADYTWNGNIQIASSSTGTEFYLGDFNGDEQRVFNMDADITLDETSFVSAGYATVNGNGNIITTRKLDVVKDSLFNDVTIKFGGDLDVMGGGTLNMTNSTLRAEKVLSAGNLNTTNSTLSAERLINAGNINVNGALTVDLRNAEDGDVNVGDITGADGATVTFHTKYDNNGTTRNGTTRLSPQTGGTGTLTISNVLLNFEDTDAIFDSGIAFTNTQIKTNLGGYSSVRFINNTFNGNNIITADSITANSLVVSANSRLTLKNLDGTGNGLLNGNLTVNDGGAFTGNLIGDLNLYGHFTGDMQGDIRVLTDHDWSFNGKFNGNIEATFKDSVFDTTCLKLAQGSTIGSLTLMRAYDSKSADVIVNSDLAVSNLVFNNKREELSGSNPENAGKITGTGTLKTEKVNILKAETEASENQTVYFDGINIAALNDNLVFDGASSSRYDFTNNAISAGKIIQFNQTVVFNGNSSLTAYYTKAEDIIINGILTVSGPMEANSITGGTDGTLNIVLPSSGTKSVIVSSYKPVSNVKLTFDLKNVKSKNAQQYFVVGSGNYGNYTIISGDYGKWAFSSDGEFTLDDWKANKDLFKLTEDLWNKSQGALWILKVAGGAESAIDDLRMAGISVSPTEENASKILDLISNNPFADRLTDLLDSGDAGLQKQALREIAPTDAASSAFKTAKSAAHAVMNAVSDWLGGASDVSGRSGGDLTAGESAAWAQGMFNHAKMTGGNGFTSGTAGFSAGVERNMTDEIKAGFGYAFASTGIKTGRSKINADTHTGFVYGEYAPGALYVNAMLGYGRSDYDDKAKLSGMKNSYKADTYSARVAAGYDMGALTPEAALRFTAVRQSAYTDDLGARVSAKNLNTTTAVVGAKAGKDFAVDKYTVSPEMKAALTYDIARPNESRMVALPDGSSYVAAGEHLNRLGFEVGAKAAVRLTNEVELSLSYDGAFKEHYQDHTGLINVKVDF